MTTERIDHVERATELGELATYSYDAGRPEAAMGQMFGAQVHATLALVEQQRIANHIAYAQLLETQYAEAARVPGAFDHNTLAASVERHGIALGRIRQGLGL